MPIYMYECPECEQTFEKELPLSAFDEPQICPECGTKAKQVVAPTNFVLRGDGWPGKGLRIKSQMKDRRRKSGQKQRDHVGVGPTLQPNVGGERVDSWSEAKKLAASKGKGTASYDSLIRQEQR